MAQAEEEESAAICLVHVCAGQQELVAQCQPRVLTLCHDPHARDAFLSPPRAAAKAWALRLSGGLDRSAVKLGGSNPCPFG